MIYIGQHWRHWFHIFTHLIFKYYSDSWNAKPFKNYCFFNENELYIEESIYIKHIEIQIKFNCIFFKRNLMGKLYAFLWLVFLHVFLYFSSSVLLQNMIFKYIYAYIKDTVYNGSSMPILLQFFIYVCIRKNKKLLFILFFVIIVSSVEISLAKIYLFNSFQWQRM